MDINEKAKCTHCGSLQGIYDLNHGYYQCPDCGGTWRHDEDDPDYDKSDDIDLQDILLEQPGGGNRLRFTKREIKGNSLKFTTQEVEGNNSEFTVDD